MIDISFMPGWTKTIGHQVWIWWAQFIYSLQVSGKAVVDQTLGIILVIVELLVIWQVYFLWFRELLTLCTYPLSLRSLMGFWQGSVWPYRGSVYISLWHNFDIKNYLFGGNSEVHGNVWILTDTFFCQNSLGLPGDGPGDSHWHEHYGSGEI